MKRALITTLSTATLTGAFLGYATPSFAQPITCNPGDNTCLLLQTIYGQLKLNGAEEQTSANNAPGIVTNTGATNTSVQALMMQQTTNFKTLQQEAYPTILATGKQWTPPAPKLQLSAIDETIDAPLENPTTPPSSSGASAALQQVTAQQPVGSLQSTLLKRYLTIFPITLALASQSKTPDFPDNAYMDMANVLMRNITPAYQGVQLPLAANFPFAVPSEFGDMSASAKYTVPTGMIYSNIPDYTTLDPDLLLSSLDAYHGNSYDTYAKKLLALPMGDSLLNLKIAATNPGLLTTMLSDVKGTPGFPGGPNPLITESLDSEFTPNLTKTTATFYNTLFYNNDKVGDTRNGIAACYALGGSVTQVLPGPSGFIKCAYYPLMAKRYISMTYLSGLGVVPSISAKAASQLASSTKPEDQQMFLNMKSSMRTSNTWKTFAQSTIGNIIAHDALPINTPSAGGSPAAASDKAESGDPFEKRIIDKKGWLAALQYASSTELLRAIAREQAIIIYQNDQARKAKDNNAIGQSIIIAELANLNQTMSTEGINISLKTNAGEQTAKKAAESGS